MTRTPHIDAFFIDSQAATITPIRLPKSDMLKAAYQTLGCSAVEITSLDPAHDLWTDENCWQGAAQNAVLLRSGEQAQFFAGNAIIAGFDPETGNTISVAKSAKELTHNITSAQAVIVPDIRTIPDDGLTPQTVFGCTLHLIPSIHEEDLALMMGGAKL